MSKQQSHKDILGYLLGILTFLAGIGLLGLVFYLAYQLFRAPLAGIESTGKLPPNAMSIGTEILRFVEQMLLLMVCAWIAAKIANLGVSKYYAATQILHTQDHPALTAKHQAAATPADRPDDSPNKPMNAVPPTQTTPKPEKGI